MGIIIFGASGAGSTTLGKEIAQRLKYQFLDIDDYLWCWTTEIPLTVTRSWEERTNGLMNDIKKHPNFVIAGTIFNDREHFDPLLDLAVFISTPKDICAARVHAREYARWGNRVLPGGDMYKSTRFHGDFKIIWLMLKNMKQRTNRSSDANYTSNGLQNYTALFYV